MLLEQRRADEKGDHRGSVVPYGVSGLKLEFFSEKWALVVNVAYMKRREHDSQSQPARTHIEHAPTNQGARTPHLDGSAGHSMRLG